MLKLLAKITYVIVLLTQLLIVARFILKLVNADENNFFASWIFDRSAIILAPLRGLVQDNITIWRFEIEFISIFAIFFLMIVAYILKEMVKTFSE
jgi:hypothetical protein